MKKFFIWFHRRRAAYHDAAAIVHPNFHETDNEFWHQSWRDWHLLQIKRLEGGAK